jgi:hypothetical protein
MVDEPIIYTVPSLVDIISTHAMVIAKTNIHRAMAYVQKYMPHHFMLNSDSSETINSFFQSILLTLFFVYL